MTSGSMPNGSKPEITRKSSEKPCSEMSRGVSAYQAGRFDEAVEQFTRAFRRSERVREQRRALYSRGCARLLQRQYADAAADAGIAMHMGPIRAEEATLRWLARELSGQPAADDYLTAHRLLEPYPEAQLRLQDARVRVSSGEALSAMEPASFGLLFVEVPIATAFGLPHVEPIHCPAAAEMESRAPMDPPAGFSRRSLAVFAALHMHRANDAVVLKPSPVDADYPLRMYTRALLFDSGSAACFANRAYLHQRDSRLVDCLTDCSAALDREPSARLYLRRASQWIALGDAARALSDVRSAMEGAGKDRFEIADAYLRVLQAVAESSAALPRSAERSRALQRELTFMRAYLSTSALPAALPARRASDLAVLATMAASSHSPAAPPAADPRSRRKRKDVLVERIAGRPLYDLLEDPLASSNPVPLEFRDFAALSDDEEGDFGLSFGAVDVGNRVQKRPLRNIPKL